MPAPSTPKLISPRLSVQGPGLRRVASLIALLPRIGSSLGVLILIAPAERSATMGVAKHPSEGQRA